MNTVHILWVGLYEGRRMVGVFGSRQLAKDALLGMTLRDERPVAPEIEEVAVVYHVPEPDPQPMPDMPERP